MHQRAMQMYTDGMSLRQVARQLQLSPQTVSNWAQATAEALPPAPQPADTAFAEWDELYTFVGQKKSAST